MPEVSSAVMDGILSWALVIGFIVPIALRSRR